MVACQPGFMYLEDLAVYWGNKRHGLLCYLHMYKHTQSSLTKWLVDQDLISPIFFCCIQTTSIILPLCLLKAKVRTQPFPAGFFLLKSRRIVSTASLCCSATEQMMACRLSFVMYSRSLPQHTRAVSLVQSRDRGHGWEFPLGTGKSGCRPNWWPSPFCCGRRARFCHRRLFSLRPQTPLRFDKLHFGWANSS